MSKQNWKSLGPALIWTALTLYAFFFKVPDPPEAISIPYFDKVVHLGIFAGFSFLYIFGLDHQAFFKLSFPKAVLLAIGFSIAYGGIVELIQLYFIPHRSGDFVDFMADIAGVLLGWTCYKPLMKWFEPLTSKYFAL
ncbi:VanZ family protein [Limibacter armeniacum]|uniref:VanZ family protein n=1 Tax=Limibacter armeniacum TaxID=466084 RepID=UPI002FE52F32